MRRLPVGRLAAAARLALGVLVALAALAGAAAADPAYGPPILPGLDPLVRATRDPRLLGAERLVLRERLLRQGVDPLLEPTRRPDAYTTVRKLWRQRANVDLVRRQTILEYNGPFGVVTQIEHPTFFPLTTPAEPLPGGFTWYPPRPVGDPVVELFVDDIDLALARRHAVAAELARCDALDLTATAKSGQEQNLINLTIPVKLPRTLEKIIGKGEKTSIKITGREHIALNGESTVTKPFIANERVSSQSLFPTLDMEQQLQINLSGTIGEKIILEVDHNSEQMGPEATKIKLMYRGLEDEIIKTIETGDVGLTLSGSQLLGYSSNKSGLFGLKVTGQVGRVDFTVVTSKQKAEASSKTFNSSGGQVSDVIIPSSDYLNNRFFRLDLPDSEPDGRRNGERIDNASIRVYKMMSPGQLGVDDVDNVAVYVDLLGFRAWNATQIDFNLPAEYGPRWREMKDFDRMTDQGGNLVAIDLRSRMDDADVLAVTYTVVDAQGVPVGYVGDDPNRLGPTQTITGGEGTYRRMKLLKAVATRTNPHVFAYVLRNIYSLGGSNIDPATFSLRIERYDNSLQPAIDDSSGLDYFRIFGLDRRGTQGGPHPDGQVDINDDQLFDLGRGLLKFPLDFPEPFNGTREQYEAYADSSSFRWDGSYLALNLAPGLYDPETLPSRYSELTRFRIVATHAAASSSINLGASNIEEGSETVTLDGRVLQRDVDYEIDYTFGEIQLKGDAANRPADSKIAVDYQYAPFLGGGNTSLTGLSLGYDLGRDSKVATTWLYQSESIVGEKAKLGEEPSKNLVGNMNLQHTFRPAFLTSVANFLSRNDSQRESSVQFSGELALSLPNPNTKGLVYLEDFEGVDASDAITLNRLGWSWASAPRLGSGWVAEHMDTRVFLPSDRVETVRWFLPKDRVLRRYLNPALVNQERDETQTAMDLYLRTSGSWQPSNWGGIMRGLSRTGLDLSKAQFIEVWVNDGVADPLLRGGRLHLDFGYMNEDGFWPRTNQGDLVVGQWEREDRNGDGVLTPAEDVGLDGTEAAPAPEYSAEFDIAGDSPYPRINNTCKNGRDDTEDLNGNGRLDAFDGYYTVTIDLKDTEPLVDVVRDYDDVQQLITDGIAWRKYRIPIAAVDSVSAGMTANLKDVTHARVWYENDTATAPSTVHLQLSELRFLGSRWEREGVRRMAGEQLLTGAERLPSEGFFLGEANNKENPDYVPPFGVHVENNIPDKEQSLSIRFADLERGHLVRASKQVSPLGDDYTGYRDMSWYWFNPSHDTADLDLLFRVGADTLNYYEVAYRFADGEVKTGWHRLSIGLAELSNAKNGVLQDDGSTLGHVPDLFSNDVYRVRVVGRPDLRRVRRYYLAVANDRLTEPANGYVYINDVRLEGVRRDHGSAQRAGVRVNLADVIKVDFDWKHNDDAYHGLDRRVGSGVNHEEWSLNNSLNVEDFVPLAGFRLPVSGSRRQTIDRPKYVINSDIEIIDPDLRAEMSTISTREQMTARLNHTPGKSVLNRFLIDPWAVQMNGAREVNEGPLQRSRTKTLQGGVTYDLRINGLHMLGGVPLLGQLPIIKGLSLVPKKLALSATFAASEQASVTVAESGVATVRPLERRRTGKLTGGIDYSPLAIVDLSFSANSDRDLLRRQYSAGINVGQENARAYDLRMTFTLPKTGIVPEGALFAPARAAIRTINHLNPALTYSGSFGDVHDPAQRQVGDPDNIRSISNNANWDLRLTVPIGEAVKSVFPERRYSGAERERMLAAQRRVEDRGGRGARERSGEGGAEGFAGGAPDGFPGAGPGGASNPPPTEPAATPEGKPGDGTQTSSPTETPAATGDELLTPEERQRREEERLLAAAEQRLDEERDEARGRQEPPPPGDAAAAKVGGGFGLRSLIEPVVSILRNTQPLKITRTTRDQSSYVRLLDKASFWYQAGFTTEIDTDESRYASHNLDHTETISLSTTTKATKQIALDLKYALSDGQREQLNAESRSRREDWPDVQVTLSGIERWRLLGGGGPEGEGWFRSSNLSVSYKRSLVVNNYTASVFNPTTSMTLQPRWTVSFPSGLSATLSATRKVDDVKSNGALTTTSQSRYGVNVRHQFAAQRFLAKLGLYKPGASQNISMDVDLSYQTNRTERDSPGSSDVAPTGDKRLSVDPRFTYQISRNLSGALHLRYSHSRNIATDQTSTSLGLGVEATFVF